ncbi:GNAT family N-acetyltransferase [Thalassotalea aquiviva]|uniref:GNAT family N-acetyltransferase n=1 Tax=Thalassotalea aquiviva TaxID=3242415 RepID=UPI00352AC52C
MTVNSQLIWQHLTTLDELDKLRDSWQQLNQQSRHGSLFTSYPWLRNWIAQFWQPNWQLAILVAHTEQTLCVFTPFYIQNNRHFAFKTLHLLGQGEDECMEVCSEYGDILCLPGFEQPAISYINTWLQSLNIDLITFDAIKPNALINSLPILKTQGQKKSPIKKSYRYLINTQKWSINELSKSTKYKYKRNINKLNQGDNSFFWLRNEDCEPYWQALNRLHTKRWRSVSKSGAFGQIPFNQFHLTLMAKTNINVSMSVLEVNQNPIAINYYLQDNEVLYFYQSGWDKTLYGHLSPGFLLHIWSIKNCDAEIYDFMMAFEKNSYKKLYGCERHDLLHINKVLKPKKHFFYSWFNKLKKFINKEDNRLVQQK